MRGTVRIWTTDFSKRLRASVHWPRSWLGSAISCRDACAASCRPHSTAPCNRARQRRAASRIAFASGDSRICRTRNRSERDRGAGSGCLRTSGPDRDAACGRVSGAMAEASALGAPDPRRRHRRRRSSADSGRTPHRTVDEASAEADPADRASAAGSAERPAPDRNSAWRRRASTDDRSRRMAWAARPDSVARPAELADNSGNDTDTSRIRITVPPLNRQRRPPGPLWARSMDAALPRSRVLEQLFSIITRSGKDRKPLAHKENAKSARNPVGAVG